MSFAFPGAYTGDAVAAGWPQDIALGVLGMIYISRQNEATVRLCNLSGAATRPTTPINEKATGANYRATIVRTF